MTSRFQCHSRVARICSMVVSGGREKIKIGPSPDVNKKA
jgi:hypothetical protein